MEQPSASPTVEILSTTLLEDGRRTVCRFNQPYGEPVAPGGLYEDPMSGHEVFAMHKVVARDGNQLTFESYGPHAVPAPLPGSVFFYRGWWVKAAMAAALDTAASWKHSDYPKDGSHEHCLFTWVTIASYAPARSAYFSEPHGWITEKAYREFIEEDVYRLRGPHVV